MRIKRDKVTVENVGEVEVEHVGLDLETMKNIVRASMYRCGPNALSLSKLAQKYLAWKSKSTLDFVEEAFNEALRNLKLAYMIASGEVRQPTCGKPNEMCEKFKEVLGTYPCFLEHLAAFSWITVSVAQIIVSGILGAAIDAANIDNRYKQLLAEHAIRAVAPPCIVHSVKPISFPMNGRLVLVARGKSMHPTIDDGDLVVVEYLQARDEVEVGDIVSFYF